MDFKKKKVGSNSILVVELIKNAMLNRQECKTKYFVYTERADQHHLFLQTLMYNLKPFKEHAVPCHNPFCQKFAILVFSSHNNKQTFQIIIIHVLGSVWGSKDAYDSIKLFLPIRSGACITGSSSNIFAILTYSTIYSF